MDSLTQAVYGAVIGQAGFQRRLGRKAVAWGAVAGTLPDLDVIATVVAGPLAEHSFHRGPTHSLLFAGLGGAGLGLLVARWYRYRAERTGRPTPGAAAGDAMAWAALFVTVFATHALLDAFTGYGTQLWLPFSNQRVAWHGLSIIDPLFTVPLLLALLAGAAGGWRRRRSVVAAIAALGLVTGYQLWTLTWHGQARDRVAERISAEGWEPEKVFVTPMPPSSVLRRAVVLTEDSVHVGFFSLAASDDSGQWQSAPRLADPVVAAVLATPEGRVFDWFAAGMTAGRTVEDGPGASRVRIDDLRFGIPGAPADTGLWGIEAPVRSEPAAAPAVGPVDRFRREPDLGSGAAGWLWRALTAGFAHAGPPPAPADHTGTVGASARTSGPS